MRRATWIVLVGLATLAACSALDRGGPTGPAPGVVTVSPANGVSGVSPTSPVVITFSQSMMQGTETNVALHEESVTGTVVAAAARWSDDRRTLTLTPAAALRPATTYVIHLAPTMMSSNGRTLDHGSCAGLGGQNVSGGMMGAGMMGGGWAMANGSDGMSFSFTTA